MTFQIRPVQEKQLPETLSGKHGRLFFRELASCLNADRPRIVLNCSRLHRMDESAIRILLRCLEEAMKRNGDVRLAEVPARAAEVLKRTGANRLFEIFDTNADAVNSFRRHPAHAAMGPDALGATNLAAAGNAA